MSTQIKLQDLIYALSTAEAQDMSDAINDFLKLRDITNCYDGLLSELAKIVGLKTTTTDADLLRALIRAKAVANKSTGKINDIKEILQAFDDYAGMSYTFQALYPKQINVQLGTTIDDSIVREIETILDQAVESEVLVQKIMPYPTGNVFTYGGTDVNQAYGGNGYTDFYDN